MLYSLSDIMEKDKGLKIRSLIDRDDDVFRQHKEMRVKNTVHETYDV